MEHNAEQEREAVAVEQRLVPLSDFIRKYQDRERFIGYCRACPNYETVWSCPPLSFSPEQYFQGYERIAVFCAYITLPAAVREAANTPELVRKTGYDIVIRVKKKMEDRLRDMEAQIPHSISLSSGGCNRCCRCARRKGEPCRKLDIMRYSLDAFGFDLTAIAKDLFSIELEWCKDRLPSHFTLIHALLLPPGAEWDCR